LSAAQDGAVAALERWRAETLASLDAAAEGYGTFARQVEAIFRLRLPAAREADLRASRDWQDGVTRALRAYAKEAGDAAAQAERALIGSFRRVEDELTSFLLRGRLRVADFLEGLARDLARPFVQRYLTGPLADALAGMFIPSTTAAAGPAATGAPTQLFPSGLYHGGGIAGEARHARLLPAALFAGAPRLHRGGLVWGEVPAVLRRGEGVFTPEQMRALAPAGEARVEVRIIDQRASGGPIETRERRGADDRRVVEVVILDAVERGIADGRMDRALRGRFGMRPVVGGR
jgi:hypothetical protein